MKKTIAIKDLMEYRHCPMWLKLGKIVAPRKYFSSEIYYTQVKKVIVHGLTEKINAVSNGKTTEHIKNLMAQLMSRLYRQTQNDPDVIQLKQKSRITQVKDRSIEMIGNFNRRFITPPVDIVTPQLPVKFVQKDIKYEVEIDIDLIARDPQSMSYFAVAFDFSDNTKESYEEKVFRIYTNIYYFLVYDYLNTSISTEHGDLNVPSKIPLIIWHAVDGNMTQYEPSTTHEQALRESLVGLYNSVKNENYYRRVGYWCNNCKLREECINI